MKIDKKNIIFNNRVSIEQIEEGTELCPKFNKEGLIPCITIEYESKEVLMFSFLNEEALRKSIETELQVSSNEIFFISAATGEGTSELLKKLETEVLRSKTILD